MSEEKFLLIGSEEFLLSYQALGLRGIVANDSIELEEILNEFQSGGYELFFIEEALGSKIYPRLSQMEDKGKYSILLGGVATSNFTLNNLKHLVEKLVGVDLFKEENDDKR